MGKQRYQTGRGAVVLLLRHGNKDGIVRDNVLRMLCSSRLFLPICRDTYDSFDHPPDILPLCSGEHLELTRFTISAAFPRPPFPHWENKGGERGGSGQLLPIPSRLPFHPAFIFFLIRIASCNSLFWPCLGLYSVEF